MRKILLIITIACSFVGSLSAQTDFPKSYAGNWTGKLYIAGIGTKHVGEVDMGLKISPTDSAHIWGWEISYLSDGKAPDVRKYQLLVKDSAKGKYSIDEKSGIVIDGSWIANVFVTRFVVGNTLLLITYKFEKDAIVFEVVSGPADKTTETGNVPEESVPLVTVYTVSNYQKAVLVRQ